MTAHQQDRQEFGLRVAGVMTTEDGLSTKGSTGKLVLHIIGAMAEFGAA